ncbi:MAG: hypothetical protein IJ523_03125 [Succinivibrionaceae bacterium]|nr:hypothetical protein [Succinivibrionaceae bacterium]
MDDDFSLLTHYDEEKTMRLFMEEGRAKGRAEGEAKGRADGQNMLIALINALKKNGRACEIDLALADEEYREDLYRQYNIVQ